MAGTYEEVAETRPRLRRDVLFTQTADGVQFHNAKRSFRLTAKTAYRLVCLLVPYLNGENRVAEICAGLGGSQRRTVAELVGKLYEYDFARSEPAEDPALPAPLEPAVRERFAAQINYVDHFVTRAAERFGRFRDHRVAVLGTDLVARWCVLSLIRNGGGSVGVPRGVDTVGNDFAQVGTEASELAEQGCPVRLDMLPDTRGPLGWDDLDSYDTVVVTGAAGSRQLLRLLREGVPRGRTVIPAWAFGDRVVVGPLMAGETTGCWACAVLRLGANTGPGAAADIWSGVCLPEAAAPGDEQLPRPLAAMVGNMLGYEIFRLVTQALPAETEGKLIIQDLDSLDVVSERLLPHPRCPLCTGRAPADEPDDTPTGALLPTATPTATTEESADRLGDRLVLVQPHAGVFTAFTDDRWTQTPMRVSSLRLATGHGRYRQVAAFDLHHVAGARLRALDTAAAVYAEHVAPLAGALTGAELDAARPRFPTIAPASLTTASGTGTAAGRVAAWTLATSMLTKERALVPAAAVRTFGPYNRQRVHAPTSAGTGAGGSAAEAAGRGLLSALSYDAVQRALHGRGRTTRILPETLEDDPELRFLAGSARNLGIDMDLLDLGEAAHSGVHVLLARAVHERDGSGDWTVAAELTWRRAAVAAMRDLLGRIQLGREIAGGEAVDTGDPLVVGLAPGALAWAADMPAPTGAETCWEDVLERLHTAGRDALVIPTGSADLVAGGITTVRVLLTHGPADAG